MPEGPVQMALALPRVLSAPFRPIAVRRLHPCTGNPRAGRAPIRPLLRLGAPVLGTEIVRTARLHADKLPIGALLGPEMPGYYPAGTVLAAPHGLRVIAWTCLAAACVTMVLLSRPVITFAFTPERAWPMPMISVVVPVCNAAATLPASRQSGPSGTKRRSPPRGMRFSTAWPDRAKKPAPNPWRGWPPGADRGTPITAVAVSHGACIGKVP